MPPTMKLSALLVLIIAGSTYFAPVVEAENPYRYFTWNVSYGFHYPLGSRQQVILINEQFPGPDIFAVTNDNLIINVFNSLNEPFLLSWNGIQNRKNSYEDGVYGTTCPIPPGKNFTYILQAKDQIGSFYYYPSLAFHKAAGGFGGIKILSRPLIPVPFSDPADDFTVLIGDWYKKNHTDLRKILDRGKKLPFADGILINGRGRGVASFTVQQGKTYRFRVCNVGLQNSLNFRIQGHKMKLVEVEGTHTLQVTYSELDVHLGQCYSVLVTMDQAEKDYYIVASSRFTTQVLNTTAVLHYSNSRTQVSGPLPWGPTNEIDWSLKQAQSIRTNLTASGPRPNPQGAYHYGMINTSRTIRLANSPGQVNGKQRYAVNSVSFVPADTPLKVADYFKIGGCSELEAYLMHLLVEEFIKTPLFWVLTIEHSLRSCSKTRKKSPKVGILMVILSLLLEWMEESGVQTAGRTTTSGMPFFVAPLRCTHIHGQLYMWPWTTWECGN